MASFFGTLIAALVGAMLAPYFSHFLNEEKIKQDERFKYLEEAYLLANKLDIYARQAMNNLLLSIEALKNHINFENIPKTQEEPFSRLHTLLDFHLNAPDILKVKIKKLNLKIISSCSPIAEAIFKIDLKEKDLLFIQAVDEAKTAVEQAQPVQEELVNWIKREQDELKLKATIFEKKYWVDIKNKYFAKFSNE